MKGLLVGYDDAVKRARRVHVPTALVRGRRYPVMPAGDLTAGARVVSPEGTVYTLMVKQATGISVVLVVQGSNGAPYRWRRKPTTLVPVTRETWEEAHR